MNVIKTIIITVHCISLNGNDIKNYLTTLRAIKKINGSNFSLVAQMISIGRKQYTFFKLLHNKTVPVCIY